MILIPHLNIHPSYADGGQWGELLGFWPAKSAENNGYTFVSCELLEGTERAVPVFYVNSMHFDDDQIGILSPAIFFSGCDDTSYGLHLKDRETVLEWIANSPYKYFDDLLQDYFDGKLKLLLSN